MNFHGHILGFVVKIKIGEKVRISEQCVFLQHNNTAIQEFKVSIMDERGATADVWRIYNPTEYEMPEGG